MSLAPDVEPEEPPRALAPPKPPPPPPKPPPPPPPPPVLCWAASGSVKQHRPIAVSRLIWRRAVLIVIFFMGLGRCRSSMDGAGAGAAASEAGCRGGSAAGHAVVVARCARAQSRRGCGGGSCARVGEEPRHRLFHAGRV